MLMVDMRTQRPGFANVKKLIDKIAMPNSVSVTYSDGHGAAIMFVAAMDLYLVWRKMEGSLDGGHAMIIQIGPESVSARDTKAAAWLDKYREYL